MAALLMTRPRIAAERFVAGLPDDLIQRFPPVYSPLIEIVPTSDPVSGAGCNGLIFTSSNAVSSAAGQNLDLSVPAFCVGEATTKAAQDAGWRAECMGQDAQSLIRALIAQHPSGPLLHLRGTHSLGNVAEILSGAGITCHEKVVYDQVLRPFNKQANALLLGQGPVIAPIFSPRTARQFAKTCPKPDNLLFVSLSDAVAQPLKALNYKHLSVCDAPNTEAMTRAVIQVIDFAV